MQVKDRLRINTVVSILAVFVILVVLCLAFLYVKQALEESKTADAILASSFERLLLRTDLHRTGSARSKAQLIAKHEQIGALLKTASEKFSDPEDKKTVYELLSLHESIGKISKTIRENREKGGARGRADALAQGIEDRLLSQLNMRVYETILLDTKLQASSRKALISSLTLAVGGILFVLLIVSAVTINDLRNMGRTFAARVQRLRDGATLIGAGDLEHRIDIRGDDEFSELAETFNVMTSKLSSTYHALEVEISDRKRAEEALLKGRDELELRVYERTRELLQAEKELRESNEQLEWRVAERTRELQAANDSLKASRRAAFNLMQDAVAARSEAEKAKEKVQASEQRIQQALNVSRSFTFEWQRESDRLSRSASCGPILKLSGEAALFDTGRHYFQCVHPDDRTRFMQIFNDMTPANDSYTTEYRVMSDGGVVVLGETGRGFFDTAGNLQCIVGVSTDITEQKQVEESLRESEERLRFHMENSPMAVIEWDRNFFITHWTGESERMFGWNAAETVGKQITDLPMVFENDIPLVEATVAKLTDGVSRQVVSTNRNYTKAGEIRYCTWYNSVMLDNRGQMQSVMSKVIDITGLKQAEDALRLAHDKLEQRVAERTEQLSETVETLLIEMTNRERAEKGLLRLNKLYSVLSETNQTIVRAVDRESLFREFCRIAVECGGFLLAWVGLVDEDTGHVEKLAACGASDYLDSVRVSRNEEPAGLGPTGISIRDGSYYICNNFQDDPCTRPWHEPAKRYDINSSASVALKEEGRVIGALTLYSTEKAFFDQQHAALLVQMGEDMSFAIDYLAREEQRRTAERALREETLERLRAVEELRKQEHILIQQSRQAAMGEMIGNIAHQWRQPLNTLGLLTQRLGFFYGSPSFDKEFLDSSVAKSMEIIQYMSRTIDDFRNFFSTERDKAEFAADEAVSKALSLVESSFKEYRIAIDRESGEGVTIYGYPNEYAQVLLNILINAKDAFREHAVTDPRITISTRKNNGFSVVTIADNAGGIPEDIIDKVFDPYFTTKGPQQGTGVGLFMAKIIIENNMGGRLSVRNSGGGAEFLIEV